MNRETTLPSEAGFRQYRFGLLLAALLVMLVYDPITRFLIPDIGAPTARVVLAVLFGWLMMSAVYAVSESRRAPLVAIALGIPALGAELVDIGFLWGGSLLSGHVLSIVFLSYVIVVLLRCIFTRDRIDPNTIFASLCIYLLLGLLWALVYSLLEHVEQGSFFYSMATEEQMRFGSSQTMLAIYFSFTTMTTLGYGDVLPLSSAARSLTTLQAITGQLYLTVLVAWLVGQHIAHSRFGGNHPRNE